MKTMRRLGLIVTVLLTAGVANAELVVTVQDAVDYTDNVWDEDLGVWFLIPREVYPDPCNWHEDHSPWHRGSNQDWGWTHDVTARVPIDATGIESATLTIMAWDVDDTEGEDDVILVNNRYMGLLTGVDRDWRPVTFTLPQAVLDDLWKDKKLYVYMDIDQILDINNGYRVTLKSSTLAIRYITSGTAPATVPVFRFWSPVTSGHFYTTDEAERDYLILNYQGVWTSEGTAYQALPSAGGTGALPVHRFWSPSAGGHFYTIDEVEKQYILDHYPTDVWTYEGIAFHAFTADQAPVNTLPVYRFWSPMVSHHFFTMDEAEKDSILQNYPPEIWTYEGIAWYAFRP